MGLIQASFLFALAGLSIPLIIHFTFRAQPRNVDLGTIKFLREIVESSRNRKRVMRWLLLSLRMGCLILLALLFARPFLKERTEASHERLVAVLIDNSGSMQVRREGQALFAQAIAQADDVIEAAGDGAHIEVAFFNENVEPLSQLDKSAVTTESRLERMRTHPASYAATDYSAAMHWANDLCAKSPASRKEVHILSDLQRTGLAWSEAFQVVADVELEIHDLGRDFVNNVAVTSTAAGSACVRPGDSTDVTATVQNAGPFALDDVSVTLELRNGNRPIHLQRSIRLDPGALETVRFELPPLEEGLWQGNVSLEVPDEMAFDNLRHVAIQSAPPIRVLIIDGDRQEPGYLN
ncbi:MAG: BatA and WFA domain-containing protein, partial [Planctomycetota bacterium]